MKQCLILFLSIFSSTLALSQDSDMSVNGRSFGSFEVGDTSYTLVSDANVREKPAISGNVIAKLPIGTFLKIEQITTDSYTLKGVRMPWYNVSFTTDNKRKSGYLWGGFMASVFLFDKDFKTENTYQYLGGVASYDEKNFKLTAQLRIAKNGQQVAALEFPTCGDLSYYPRLELHGNCFNNINQAITYGANYDACDYPRGEYLIFWTKNNQLQKIMATTSASGAGTGYGVETYILPTHRGGINNHILVSEDSAAEEEDKNGDYKIKDQKTKISLWKWTGIKLIKVQ